MDFEGLQRQRKNDAGCQSVGLIKNGRTCGHNLYDWRMRDSVDSSHNYGTESELMKCHVCSGRPTVKVTRSSQIVR
jgi:hypothetical protein